MTEKVRYRLTLKERPSGQPYFMLEARDRELSIIKDKYAWLSIELRPEITFEQAASMWKMLDCIIAGLS